jgi:hypothetical protein
MNKILKIILIVLGVILALFIIMQLLPIGRNHTNPPVLQEPNWISPETRALAKRACFDCHSNESVWPWYSNIAPISWLVQRDVDEGREYLNFSEWGSREQEIDEIYEVVQEGEMPLPIYLITHPEARLTAAEKEALLNGFRATFGSAGD